MALRFAAALILLALSPGALAQAPTPPAVSPPAETPGPPADRVFCMQSVAPRVADPASVPDQYRTFLGIWSDASWTPQLCAALIVENITADGAATITYIFGPMGSGNNKPGGVLHGTGIVKDGELQFQNADGSQYRFKPYYSDLSGTWTAPDGKTYQSVFEKTL